MLIANTENRPGTASADAAAPAPRRSRTVPGPLDVDPAGQQPHHGPKSRGASYVSQPTFGVLVESTGPSPVQLVVESATYRSTYRTLWLAGGNALATPLP